MRVAVIGTGAMGSIFGSALAHGGDTVVFFDNREELVAAIQRDGLFVEGALGSSHLRPRATADATAVGPVDCALVLVNASATPAAACVASSCLARDGFVLTLQNGIGNVEALSKVVGGRTGTSRFNLQQRHDARHGPGPALELRPDLDRGIVGRLKHAGGGDGRTFHPGRASHDGIRQHHGRGVEQVRAQLRHQSH